MAPKPCVKIEALVMGPIENNVFIIEGPGATFVVDPTMQAPRIVKALAGRKLDAIVLTHFHWDHVGAANELRNLTGARTIASSVDAPVISGAEPLPEGHVGFEPCPIDCAVEDGDVATIGQMPWRVLVTPGHTPGSMCLLLESRYGTDPQGAPVLISGDTLFAGAHGRTDFAEGSPADMRESLLRLAELPEDALVLPGHNALTTIGNEIAWLKRGGF